MDATINADVIDPGWWADPSVWIISAVALVVIIIIGIYFKVLVEHQRFNLDR